MECLVNTYQKSEKSKTQNGPQLADDLITDKLNASKLNAQKAFMLEGLSRKKLFGQNDSYLMDLVKE